MKKIESLPVGEKRLAANDAGGSQISIAAAGSLGVLAAAVNSPINAIGAVSVTADRA